MAKIYTVVSGKGGVGKSTFCVNIALSLSEKGKNVLLIDGDIGLRCLDLLSGLQEMVLYDWSDVIAKRCDHGKARLFYNDNLHLLPAPLEYSEKINIESFKKLLSAYSNEYDYIFIDSPAGIGELPQIYSKCSDECIVVSTPDEVSARSACVAGDMLVKNGVKENCIRLVINRFDKKAIKSGKLLNIDTMIDKTYLRLLGIVPEDRNLTYVSVTEKTLSQYCDAKTAFNNIAERINGNEMPLYL